MKVLYIGEIVGSSGVFCVKNLLAELKESLEIDFVIASADGATGGFGVGKNHSIYLHKLGIDILTSGECIYYKKDMVTHIVNAPYILRAANYPIGNPGRGWRICTLEGKGEEGQASEAPERKLAVINLLGLSGMNRVHPYNPFLMLPDLVEKISQHTRNIVVDFHAATTAEKYTMYHYMDGKVSAILGSHTKVLSADEAILPGGTAVISGTGRTGSRTSVGGLEPSIEIRKLITQIYEPSKIAWSDLELQGVILTIGEDGRAEAIERVRRVCKEPEHERNRDRV